MECGITPRNGQYSGLFQAANAVGNASKEDDSMELAHSGLSARLDHLISRIRDNPARIQIARGAMRKIGQ